VKWFSVTNLLEERAILQVEKVGEIRDIMYRNDSRKDGKE
jgi:hypothetical protein